MQPIEYEERTVKVDTLTPGYRGDNCHFDYRKYEDRSPDQQADYDRLIASIFHHGVLKPLITFHNDDGHYVLIGMRRWEIMYNLGRINCRVWVITDEDPGTWLSPDIDRLNELKKRCGIAKY